MSESFAETAPSPKAPASVQPVTLPGVSHLLMLAVFVVVVTALYFARAVMLPITLAVLLSFLLAPLVALLRRVRLPRVPAVLLSVVVSLGVVLALGGLIGSQVANLAGDLPQYQETVESKLQTVQALTVGQLSVLIDRLGGRLQHVTAAAHPAAGTPAGNKPVTVQVQAPPPSPLQIAEEVLGRVLAPLATGGIVFTVAVFILLQQEDLRDRLIRLCGSNDLHRTTVALDDAGRRLSRYFLTQLGINTAFGCVITAGLLAIGVPSPVLWGVLGALLRFVPYVGSWLSAIFPTALAAAVDPGWSMAGWTVVLYLVVELLVGQVIEPFMYGRSTGLSPISVVVAAIFWSWLWGPIGLILSTPLTLCLVVLGRHVPRLEFLDVLLGDRPALSPVESFYQRILAGHADEALTYAEPMLRDLPLSSYYDAVVVPGLRLAAIDVERGVLPPARAASIVQTVLDLVGDLAEYDDTEADAEAEPISPVAPPDQEAALPRQPVAAPDFDRTQAGPVWGTETPVLCVAGRGPFDPAIAAIAAQVLGKHGLGARSVSHEALARSRLAELDPASIAMVCLCYVDVSASPTHLRFLLRRLRQQLPTAGFMVGLWPSGKPMLQDGRLRDAIGAQAIAGSISEMVATCLRTAQPLQPPPVLQQRADPVQAPA